MWIARRSSATLAVMVWRPGVHGMASNKINKIWRKRCGRRPRDTSSSSRRKITPRLAPHRLVAVSMRLSKTSCSSNCERLMIFSTSAVAVCCSNASVRSFGALTQFVEQPRVLDGDDGLRGEVRDQLDLLVGERTHFLAGQDECTNHFALVQQRNAQERPYAAKCDCRDGHWIMLSCVDLLCRYVPDMNHRFVSHHTADRRLRIRAIR